MISINLQSPKNQNLSLSQNLFFICNIKSNLTALKQHSSTTENTVKLSRKPDTSQVTQIGKALNVLSFPLLKAQRQRACQEFSTGLNPWYYIINNQTYKTRKLPSFPFPPDIPDILFFQKPLTLLTYLEHKIIHQTL